MSTAISKTIALITGANQGIGFEIAKKLATEQKGYHVIMCGRRKEAIETSAETLRKSGLPVEPLVMDITSDESIGKAVEAVEAKHGHLDVLINNAAIMLDGDAVEDRAAWAKVYDTNVFSSVAVTDAFIPLLEKSSSTKRVVFMSTRQSSIALSLDSTSPVHASHRWRVYSSSKVALNLLAVQYAIRFEKDPTWKINIDHPGHCATNFNRYSGKNPASSGAINACRLATLGPDGETGTFSSKDGPVPW